MGTNYYIKQPVCPTCGNVGPSRHIGKSSAGWAFSLRVYREENIQTIEDWMHIFEKNSDRIFDEYGRQITPMRMLALIVLRAPSVRHIPADSMSQPGEGTYDYVNREIS